MGPAKATPDENHSPREGTTATYRSHATKHTNPWLLGFKTSSGETLPIAFLQIRPERARHVALPAFRTLGPTPYAKDQGLTSDRQLMPIFKKFSI